MATGDQKPLLLQCQIDVEIVEAMAWIVKELRRSTRSHDWDDMEGLRQKIAGLRSMLQPQDQLTYNNGP